MPEGAGEGLPALDFGVLLHAGLCRAQGEPESFFPLPLAPPPPTPNAAGSTGDLCPYSSRDVGACACTRLMAAPMVLVAPTGLSPGPPFSCSSEIHCSAHLCPEHSARCTSRRRARSAGSRDGPGPRLMRGLWFGEGGYQGRLPVLPFRRKSVLLSKRSGGQNNRVYSTYVEPLLWRL